MLQYVIKIKHKDERAKCQQCKRLIQEGDTVYLIYVNENLIFPFCMRNHQMKFYKKHEKAFVKDQLLKNFKMHYIVEEKHKVVRYFHEGKYHITDFSVSDPQTLCGIAAHRTKPFHVEGNRLIDITRTEYKKLLCPECKKVEESKVEADK